MEYGSSSATTSGDAPTGTILLKNMKESTRQTSRELIEAAEELENSHKQLSFFESQVSDQQKVEKKVAQQQDDFDWKLLETKSKQLVLEASSYQKKNAVNVEEKSDGDNNKAQVKEDEVGGMEFYPSKNQVELTEADGNFEDTIIEKKTKKWSMVINHEGLSKQKQDFPRKTELSEHQDVDDKDETDSDVLGTMKKKQLILELNNSNAAKREDEESDIKADVQDNQDDKSVEESVTCPVCDYPNWYKMLQFVVDHWGFMWWLPLTLLLIGILTGWVLFFWIGVIHA